MGAQSANRVKETVVGRWLFYIIYFMGIWNLKTYNLESIDQTKTYVVVCNHQSMADNAILCFLKCSPSGEKKYLTKKQYFQIPFFGWLQWLAGDIPVDLRSEESRKRSINRCKNALKP